MVQEVDSANQAESDAVLKTNDIYSKNTDDETKVLSAE
jgi:hypothetical protein